MGDISHSVYSTIIASLQLNRNPCIAKSPFRSGGWLCAVPVYRTSYARGLAAGANPSHTVSGTAARRQRAAAWPVRLERCSVDLHSTTVTSFKGLPRREASQRLKREALTPR